VVQPQSRRVASIASGRRQLKLTLRDGSRPGARRGGFPFILPPVNGQYRSRVY